MSEQTNTPPPNKMGSMPIGKLLVSMVLPLMISMLTQACYNIVDSIFVSRVSENALTAVSLSFPVQMLLISVAVGTGIGINSLISRKLGQGNALEASQTAANGLFLMLLSSLVFLVLGFTLVKPFFRLFTDDPEILSMGVSYLSIVLIFCMGVFMQMGCDRIMQATGNTLFPMITQLVGAAVNIVLDPILIFGYFGFPAMGITGAAVATVIGQWIGMGLSLLLLFYKSRSIRPSFHHFRPSASIIRGIYAVGLPSAVMQAIGTVMTLGLNLILINFTPTAVSVLGVYFKLNSFIFMPVFALNSGAMSIMAYSFGARNRKRLMQALQLNLLYGFGIMVVGLCLFQFFAEAMLRMFDASPSMLAIGVPALKTISIAFPPAAICIGLSSLFQALGKGVYSLLTSVLRQLVVILPLAYLFSQFLGLSAVWWAFPLSEIASLTAAALFYYHIRRKIIAPLEIVESEDLPDLAILPLPLEGE